MKNIKFLITIILSFLVTFIYNPASYANVSWEKENISIENAFSSSSNISEESIKISRDLPENEELASLWVASIVIPGLGQILMGDGLSGLKYLIGVPLVFFLGLFIGSNIFRNPNVFLSGLNEGLLIGFIAGIVVHIWNITDAVELSEALKRKGRKERQTNNNYLFNVDIISYSF